MNQTQSYMDMHPSHLTSTQPYSHADAPDNVSHYNQYSQAPILNPGPAPYGHHNTSYHPYPYPNGASSSPSTSGPMSSFAPLPPMPATNPGPMHYAQGGGQYAQSDAAPMDTTGQIPPPGVKPKVSATVWEDESTHCYQIEVEGVCVARRTDNNMINGTKLLNVAKMTRGRRDGILKSEKVRHVVKVGPMHLKGVWIPFDRALDFANKERITPILYPLFHPQLSHITVESDPKSTDNGGAAADRRRLQAPPASAGSRSKPDPRAPPLHHHHSMSSSIPPQVSQPSPQGIPSGASSARPSLERAHTFPTAPTTGPGIMPLPNQGSSYDWSGQDMGGAVQGPPPPLSIDSGLSGARSVPTTPVTGPSAPGLSSLHQYQSQTTYDSKPPTYYATPQSSQPPYGAQSALAQPSISSQGNALGHGTPAGETHPQEPEYVNGTNSPAYHPNRNPYGYATGSATNSLHADHSQMSPQIQNSASHPNGSLERVPSRLGGQPQWPTPSYSSQRSGPPPPSAYNVLNDTRGPPTNATVTDPYGTPQSNGYPPMKGSNKRGREDDRIQDQLPPPTQTFDPSWDYKRRKTISDSSVNGIVNASAGLQSVTTGAISRQR